MTLLPRFLLPLLALALAGGRAAPPVHPLVWDAMEKTVVPRPGEEAAEFAFTVTNKADREIAITEVDPSCGCTVVDLPATPWTLAPGASGTLRATVDFQGKSGRFGKSILVASSAGAQVLKVNVDIPDTPEARRARNLQLARMDRQAVFRGDCATCHALPAAGKIGAELFQLACGICHAPAHRADIVPDLAVARGPRDAEYWRTWIRDGKPGTLMPAFASEQGGPLTPPQIDSLVAYLLQTYPRQP